MWRKLKAGLGKFLFREEGGKRRLNRGNAFWTALPAGAVIIGAAFFPKPLDTSFAERTSKPLTGAANGKTDQGSNRERDSGKRANGISDPEGDAGGVAAPMRRRSNPGGDAGGIKYHAVQIVQRQGGDPGRTLPIGTSFIARLLTGIDTREPHSLVRVLVPYGGSFDHDRRIERNSVLFGTVSYTGSGDKVYIQFNRLLFPDGREFRISGEALSSADYSPGLACDVNDGAGGRVATTVGLTMLSGVSDVLVEKESLGQYAEPTAKSNLRNGFFNGLTKATNEEAQRRAAKMNNAQDYCTASAGADLIVSLIETFKGEQL